MNNQPAIYNFLPHYKGDGLSPFTITILYDDGTPMDISGFDVLMQLKMGANSLPKWSFGTGSGVDTVLTIPTGVDGVIQFPEIKKWNLDAQTFDYDLQITDNTGFVKTYLRGKWAINQDITKSVN